MRLSACSIVKNEAKNIARSIESYREVVDEIIIVDTGSTDNTVEICEKLGARVLHFEWINDFAAAKNFALEHAKGNWVIFLDADEWFVPKLCDDRIFKVLDRIEVLEGVGVIKTILCNVDENTGFVSSRNSAARIFRNGPDVRYVGEIHEDIRKAGKPIKSATLEELEIYHCGYSAGRVVDKSKRNLEIIYDMYRNGKADTALYFYLCRENAILGNYEEALKFYELFFKQEDHRQVIARANIFISIYEYGITIKQKLPQKFTWKDMEKDILEAVEKCPDFPIYRYHQGLYYFNFDYDKALDALEEAVRLHKAFKGSYINSFAQSLPDAHFRMAQIYRARQLDEAAFDHYVLSLQLVKTQEGPFKELLQLIRAQASEDIIQFLNSIYDINNKEHVEFLAKQLMCSRLHQVFLYYALRYNKQFDGQNETTYIAMILTNNEELAVETAMTAYFNAGKEDDRFYAVLAIMSKRREDLFEKYKTSLAPGYANVMNRYLKGQKLDKPAKEEISAALALYRYMFYLWTQKELDAFEEIFEAVPPDFAGGVIECCISYKDHAIILDKAEAYIRTQKTEHFKVQMYKLLGFSCYFKKGFSESLDYFGQALACKEIDVDRTMMIYLHLMRSMEDNDVIRHRASKLLDRYEKLFSEYTEAVDRVRTGKFQDDSTEEELLEWGRLTEEGLRMKLEPLGYNIPTVVESTLFTLAEKYLEKEMDICALKTIFQLARAEYKKDILYFRMGEIFSRIGNVDLALYCHKVAFSENATFAETLIQDKSNDNRNYIYTDFNGESVKQCPICGGNSEIHSVFNAVASPDFLPQYPALKIWRYCSPCHHLFAQDIPSGIPFEMEEEKAKAQIKAIPGNLMKYEDSVREIRSRIHGNKWIDIGSGDGVLLAVALEYGFDACGVEPVKNLALLSSKTLGAPIYDSCFEDLENIEGQDVISMVCVMEGFAAPKEAVRRAYEFLNNDGLMYIETPNFESGYARVMKDKSWTLRSGRILNYFSKESLYGLLTDCGFEIVSYRMSKRNNGYMEVIARKK